MLKQTHQNILSFLEKELSRILPTNHNFAATCHYAVMPPGKLFRPLLVAAIAQGAKQDNQLSKNHLHLACAVEMHHAYTLVHDDLPCMDDDNMRRGKPSCHIAFNEWKALLAGDALINASYEVLGQINSPSLARILRLFSRFLGGKGLILGQVMDLEIETNKNFKTILEIHYLKTARLLQTCLLGSELLKNPQVTTKKLVELLRLGKDMGWSFQLLDDLNELIDPEISKHEKEINPFLEYQSESFSTLLHSLKRMRQTCLKLNYPLLSAHLHNYAQLNIAWLKDLKRIGIDSDLLKQELELF